MLKNYLTIALRNFLRHKTYGLISSGSLPRAFSPVLNPVAGGAEGGGL